MDGLGETQNVILERGAASGDHNLDVHMLAQVLAHLGCLERKLTRRDEEEGLNLGKGDVDLLEGGNNEGGGLACTVLCTGKNVAFGESKGDGLFLNGRGTFKAFFKDSHQQFAAQVHVLPFHVCFLCDVLQR